MDKNIPWRLLLIYELECSFIRVYLLRANTLRNALVTGLTSIRFTDKHATAIAVLCIPPIYVMVFTPAEIYILYHRQHAYCHYEVFKSEICRAKMLNLKSHLLMMLPTRLNSLFRCEPCNTIEMSKFLYTSKLEFKLLTAKQISCSCTKVKSKSYA